MLIEQVLAILENREQAPLRSWLKEAELADIAEIFENIQKVNDRISLFKMIPKGRRAHLFPYFSLRLQQEFLEDLPEVVLGKLFNDMEADTRTHLLEDLSLADRDRILHLLHPHEREVADQLLSYPESSVGRLMNPDFLALKGEMSASEALAYIHWSHRLPEEFLQYLFVTDAHGCLLGEVSLPTLVMCDPPSALVMDIMKPATLYLHPYQKEDEALGIIRRYGRSYIPVVDDMHVILGMVTDDDLFELAEDLSTENIQQFGGQEALEKEYFDTSLLVMMKKRIPWLCFFFIAGSIPGEAMRAYDQVLEKWPFLVLFLPMITAAGGSCGSQAASLIIRGLAVNHIAPRESQKVLIRELIVGLTLGFVLAILGSLRSWFWGFGTAMGEAVAVSLVGVALCGVVVGSMMPFIFRALKWDPAVVSSPFVSAIMDLTGFLIFIHCALWFLP